MTSDDRSDIWGELVDLSEGRDDDESRASAGVEGEGEGDGGAEDADTTPGKAETTGDDLVDTDGTRGAVGPEHRGSEHSVPADDGLRDAGLAQPLTESASGSSEAPSEASSPESIETGSVSEVAAASNAPSAPEPEPTIASEAVVDSIPTPDDADPASEDPASSDSDEAVAAASGTLSAPEPASATQPTTASEAPDPDPDDTDSTPDEAVATPIPADTEPGADDMATASPTTTRTRRRPLRAATVLPVVGLAALYTASTLLWPLDAVAPTVTEASLDDLTSAEAAIVWPDEGSAAVGIDRFDSVAASGDDAHPIASITKLVTMLMVLERSPLALGEQGPVFSFTSDDENTYQEFLGRDESALDVPVDGVLTQYQLMQGVLLGSAGNYAERLARATWPDDGSFATAAADWLQRQGLKGITVVEPTGIDERNTADAASLVALSKLALADPVIAEIVRTRQVDLPGAGLVKNTNRLVVDPQVVGVKTGSLESEYTLTAAKTFTVGHVTLRAYAAVLAQPDAETRFDETDRLLSAVIDDASRPHTLPAGTTVASVSTAWGERTDAVTTTEIGVALWNGAAATPELDLHTTDARSAGDEIGEVRLAGPADIAATTVRLTDDLPDPSAWWRLSHPLQLWGLAG